MRTVDSIGTDIRLGVVRGIQYGLVADPDQFAAHARDLGARLLRVFLYWSQLEPEPGRYDWTAVDAVLDQTDEDTELWFMIGAASPWGATRATDFLPASVPTDPQAYARMVRALVERCDGRVRYWQCENEPCNRLFWVGTADEYIQHLRVFSETVRSTDPYAAVVLGGCPPGVFPTGSQASEEREFFGQLLGEAHDVFDVFDIHLYGDPYVIPATIADVRSAMRSHGYEKPVVVGEYNGPIPLEYPEVLPSLADVMRSGGANPWHRLTAAQFRTGELSLAPARDAMRRLYERMAELPPGLQMFMTGCPQELEDTRHRLNARDIVIRNLLALSCGVRRTACWQIRPDTPEPPDKYEFLRLMFSKFNLLAYDDQPYPCADAFAELASHLVGADAIRHVELPEHPHVYLFEVTRGDRAPLYVTWLRGDPPNDTRPPQTVAWNGLSIEASTTPSYIDTAVQAPAPSTET